MKKYLLAVLILALFAASCKEASRSERRGTETAAQEPEVRMSRTGYVYDAAYLNHRVAERHPERPERLDAINARLRATGLMEKLLQIAPRRADRQWITTVHSDAYVSRVERLCAEGARMIDTPDVPVSGESYETAQLAVGGVLAAVDAVMEGRARNAFCAIRPPGHHALRERAMGFCLFNNVACAARYAQKRHGAKRILIVDWDVHHGNGTQAMFEDDPDVFFFSIHQAPFYPGTGREIETGIGDGKGTVLNVPLPAGTDDEKALEVFRGKLKPAALEFRPELVIVSAGFDAYENDPLGGFRLTADCFGKLTEIVMEIAEECCDGRIVSALEGGYDLDGLGRCVEAHIRALLGPGS